MKLATVALLSTLGMALTSAGVWALTPPASAKSPTPALAVTAPRPTLTDSPRTSLLGDLLATNAGSGAAFTSGSTLMLEGRLGHPTLDATRDNETFLMLNVRAAAEELASTPAPVNLSIVIDRSRSMEGRRLDNALAAARGMVRRLRDGDTVSVVTYNTETTVVVPATVLDARSRDDVLFALRSVEAQGHTCISCGIETGLSVMGRRPGVSRMLLLSDGEANAGIRDVPGFERLAEDARSRDVAISSIGVDVDYNERVMFAVAQSSNGRHYFVENEAGLPRIFDEELDSLVRTVASRAEVELDLAPGVQLLEVMDRSFSRDGNRIFVPFGAFAQGDTKTLLVRLRVPRGQAGDRAVAEVRMRYEDLTRQSPGDCQGSLVAQLTADSRAVSPLDPLVESRVARSETSAALVRANELFAEGDVVAAQRTLDSSRGRIRERKDAARTKADVSQQPLLDEDFERQLDALEQAEQGFSAAAAEPAPAASRKGKAQIRSNAGALDEFGL
ncbi:vWA domain-containing protein [Paraliomyxa miuraensis]|uniref:vWA domain-containing protein n=1 Tax=Paraliomyxa miuraensis TaxID=376150 RepID=UPI0022516275|nr:VWA domain-containing protein [Paraliomyxa miuraensis]MCX4245598.1 VWA domain-containing protein [Paraliomyxa miuraensis]